MVRCALVGCGRVAPRHADSITALPDTTLVAVADPIESRANHFATKYGAEATTDWHRVLDRSDVDVVHIATPSGMHADMAVTALEAGKHVLVEKPLALSLADADRMIATAQRTGKRLGVMLQNRYNAPMQELKRLVESGKLGRIHLGSATVRWYRPQEYYEDGWHGTWAMDGGALMNQSVHHIDALQWLIGEPESVYAQTATRIHKMEAEDVGVAIVKFRGGALATIEGSTITWPENLEGSVALFGDHGSVKVGGTALNRKEFWKVDGSLEHEREALTHDRLDPPSVYGQSHQIVTELFARAVRDGGPTPAPATDARRSLAVVLGIYESARTGKPVDLTQAPWTLG
ncbi:MAG: Gfo/Idh/MocA family oxidoreductase [Gemmatimonadaceae bacterium]|nr:Gfo/Idh/MocA family oxidoreductase [Gemmatimonadaceae bacterium]